MRLLILAFAALSLVAQSEKYNGPRPTKPDVPYLLHADKLVELDNGSAQQSEQKNDTVYTMAGATAQAKTPMPEPIFVINAQKINPEQLSLFRVNTGKSGGRELVIPKKAGKNGPRPVRVTAVKLDGSLWKVEAQEFLENGEYCLSPEGSNQTFCFSVF